MISSLLLASLLVQSPSPADDSALIERFVPTPLSVSRRPGEHQIYASTVLHYENVPGLPSLEPQARVLAANLEVLTGHKLEIAPFVLSEGEPGIELRLAPEGVPDQASEAYHLLVTEDEIFITGDPAGVSHGCATLLQALEVRGEDAQVPCLSIKDRPRSAYRSLMIDVARKPHTIPVLQDVIRLAHLYKLRYLHLHLTDDQLFAFPFEPVVSKLEDNAYFTRTELTDLVKYASAHGLILVPEIDLPGHSRRLIESGYLESASNHADVAAPRNFAKINALLDDVMDVFHTSPYLHIGGDESGAGEALLPFLASVQKHVRSRDKRLIVWEGFHGAPTDILPATGEDRVIVAAWESSYNAPWNLLEAGYELINASWKPLYVVGGGAAGIHPGSSGGRRWTPREMADWSLERFQHWEPHRPVFEDQGPADKDLDDGEWTVPGPWRSQLLGGQISVWEQEESSLVRDLHHRVPMLAERLWSGDRTETETLLQRARSVDERLLGIVQPVEILPASANGGPLDLLFRSYAGAKVEVRLRNRTRLKGSMQVATKPFRGNLTWIAFESPTEFAAYKEALTIEGGATVRARFVRQGGNVYGGDTWARFQNWPSRVAVTEYDIGRRTPETVPKFEGLPVTASYELPMLRGPLANNAVRGQRFAAQLHSPGNGEFTLSMKTQSGRASLFLDLDRNGTFEPSERVIQDTPTSEEPLSVTLPLTAEAPYALRIDHASGLPRPVVLAYLEGPGTEGRQEISPFLELPALEEK